MNNNVTSLIDEINEGFKPDFLFFYGHIQQDQLGTECLSQWYPATFVLDGISYYNSEQYMMSEKARLFNDDNMLDKILSTQSPCQAKKYGRCIKNFDDMIWTQNRFNFVVNGNTAKFGQNKHLKKFLLNTKNQILVEASPHDKIWGIGMSKNNPDVNEPTKWKGLNLLGFALMEVRSKL